MKRIEIIVSPQGESRIESFGFVGRACRIATAWFEKTLGIRRADHLKPEYFEQQTTNVQQQESP